MKKLLNMKNMKEVLVNYSGDQKELDKIWDAFHVMACCGFVDNNTWRKFFEQCRGWYVDEENACVRDDLENDAIVWEYTGEAEYRA